MLNKTLTLTIVIPAYNEQSYLGACLDSIAAQSVRPDEVIVIDNNSDDQTALIAKSYDFVRLIKEPNQHQSFAQQTGFNAAASDIIGRIDADTILPVNWVNNVKSYFANNPGAVGITGSTLPYDFSVGAMGAIGFEFYIYLASRLAGHRLLWGANCAIRRDAWIKVQDKVMTRGDIWEDYDLAFCLAPLGQLHSVGTIDVGSSFRAVQQSLVKQTRYQFRAVRTFYFHRGLAKSALMLAMWSSLYILFIPVMLDKYIFNPLANLAASNGGRKRAPKVVQLEAE